MKITDFNFECPMLTSIYCERYINDTKGRFEDYSEVNKLFDPQGNVTEFQIPFTWINELELEIFQSSPSCKILNNIRRGDTYKFFWHPDTSRMDLSVDGYAIMQPTSSTRTMLEMQKLEYYVKTDLDKKHFRFIRRLKGDSVKHSIDICNDLRELTSWLPQSSTYSFLPESIGLIIKNGIHKRSGVIYREAKPFPESTGKKVMIPYHSLYADDMKDPDTPPILIQLCEIHANQSPLNFFLEYIIGFVQNAWVMLVTKRGLLPELHGQNALLEIDESLFPVRLVHRDFQGTYSDNNIRNMLNLKVFEKHVIGEEIGTTRESQYSHVYDGMIGKYLFARLTNTFCRYYNQYTFEEVANEIASRFHNIEGNITDMFPPTTFKFSNSAFEQTDNEVSLVNTNQKPIFR